MNESRRQKKVASLLQATLGRPISEIAEELHAGLITIIRVDISKDLKTAYVYLSAMESSPSIPEMLSPYTGRLRKQVASHTDLKYNPKLIFRIDPTVAFENTMNRILEITTEDD